MSTYQESLASFCSYGGRHERFLTAPEKITRDLEQLMTEYGVSLDLRNQVYEALSAVRFDEGFRFEHDLQHTRLVVYACLRNPYCDRDLKPLSVNENVVPQAWELL